MWLIRSLQHRLNAISDMPPKKGRGLVPTTPRRGGRIVHWAWPHGAVGRRTQRVKRLQPPRTTLLLKCREHTL